MRKRRLRVFLAALLLCVASLYLVSEWGARGALHRADFSHDTYWKDWPFWTRKEIRCGDRNPTDMDWIKYYPNLEGVYLTAGSDNCNSFPQDELRDFKSIRNLKVLHLSGVRIDSYSSFPEFPRVEEVRFTESTIPARQLTEDENRRMKNALPRIRSFSLEGEYSDNPRLIYDQEREIFVFVHEDGSD